jgi:hypothetical protein
MARRLIIGVVLASTAVVSAAGCGGSSKKSNAAGPEVTWARHACESLQNSNGPKLQLPSIDPRNSAKSKQSIVTFLNGLSDQLGGVQVRLTALGSPPVADGKQTLGTALSHLSQTQAAVKTAAADIGKAKVTNAKSLQSALAQAGQVMRRFQTYQGPARDLRTNPALSKAFDQAVACQTRKM